MPENTTIVAGKKRQRSIGGESPMMEQFWRAKKDGLSVFPTVWDESLNDGASCPAGRIDVPVGDQARADIEEFLSSTEPYGLTPIKATLATLLTDPAAAGLADSDRNNFVLLITDGEETCSIPELIPDQIQQLRALPQEVLTYVVGFDFAEISPNLNCYAVLGGTPTPVGCEGLGVDDCDQDSTACYHNASDAYELGQALQQVFSNTVSCTYQLRELPGDLGLISVTMSDGQTSVVPQDPNHGEGWDVDSTTGRLSLYGSFCQQVRDGTGRPEVRVDCP